MGVFSKFKDGLQNGSTSSGGAYIEDGSHEFEIVGWKSIQTRKSGVGHVADFRVIASTKHTVGTIRNNLILLDTDMGPGKMRALLIAASGLIEGLDREIIEAEDWLEVLEQSCLKPAMFLGNTVLCEAPRILRKDAKLAAKRDPALANDPEWYRENSYVRLDFSATQNTRSKMGHEKA